MIDDKLSEEELREEIQNLLSWDNAHDYDAIIQEARADAWDEGRTAGNAYEADVQKWHRLRSSRFLDDMPEYPDKPRNPYRAEQMEGDDA